MKKTLLTGFILLVLTCCFSCTSKKKLQARLGRIAVNMLTLDSLNDFSSNENHPVPDVQNIGPGLYGKVRKYKETSGFRFRISELDCERIGKRKGFCYEIKYFNSEDKSLRFYVRYLESEDIFQITGY